MDTPAPTINGHDIMGRFVKGNGGGPGNPHAKQVARLRAALMQTITDEAMKEIMLKLIEMAKAGNLPAIKLIFDRTLGKPAVPHAVAVQPVAPMPVDPQVAIRQRQAQNMRMCGHEESAKRIEQGLPGNADATSTGPSGG